MITSLEEIRKPFRKASLRHLPVLDRDVDTLHIRCGNDIEKKLAIAGFVGDFLHFSDPYIQNEIPNTESLDDFILIRSEQLSSSLKLPIDEIRLRLQEEYEGLQKAKDYSRVVMWFEHDPYDQLILARLLSFFAVLDNRPRSLQLICVSEVPGIRHFLGLGQLLPEDLHNLWTDRKEVSETQFKLGVDAWRAISSNTPEQVLAFLKDSSDLMPVMSNALKRFLQELPSSTNGLSLSEELTLKILRDKDDLTAERLFHFYNDVYEPMAFMGDSSYWALLEGLANADQPAITLKKYSDDPAEWKVNLTATGLALLHSNLDWLKLNHIVRWVGGILVDSSKAINWRFERNTGEVIEAPAR